MASTVAEKTTDLSLPRDRAKRRRATRRTQGVVTLAADRPRSVPGWEWALAVFTVFVLARSPVLFYRERVGELFEAERAFYVWPDDAVLRATFATVLFAMFILSARRCQPRELLRQPFLLGFLAMAFASVTWSIEPKVSLWRVTLFAGTTVVGWYLGERYTTRELLGVAGAVAAAGALASLVAAFAWPLKAQATNRHADLWSGVYVNRNLLALVMATGLLTVPFLWASLPRRRRMLIVVVGALEAFLLIKTGSRTPLVALGAAAAVGVPLVAVRKATTRGLKPIGGAFAVGLVSGYVALIVHWNWGTIVGFLGRTGDLSRRTIMWSIDAYYSRRHPWKGWGFEAIWAHPPTIGVAETIYRAFPYSAHSGYYEILLGVGRIGTILFVGFLVVALWRAFRLAWEGRDAASIWPLTYIVFACVMNISESLFVSSEATWALTVAAAVVATRARGRRRTIS